MRKFKDISGQRFGHLTAISIAGKRNNRFVWFCKCDCGNEVEVDGNSLRTGNTLSCGCLASQIIAERNFRHGQYGTPEYRSWASMLSRCTNQNVERYSRYGGRGITVCDRWKSFENFLADMGNRPTSKHSINRIDNDGNYEKENCEWSIDQQSNTSRSVRLAVNGITKTLAQWSKQSGIKEATIRRRIKVLKWSVESSVTTPARAWRSA